MPTTVALLSSSTKRFHAAEWICRRHLYMKDVDRFFFKWITNWHRIKQAAHFSKPGEFTEPGFQCSKMFVFLLITCCFYLLCFVCIFFFQCAKTAGPEIFARWWRTCVSLGQTTSFSELTARRPVAIARVWSTITSKWLYTFTLPMPTEPF